jgi:hypothetical protein
MQKTKPPPDYITSKQLADDHGIDAEQQVRLLYDGKLTGYRLTGKLQPFYPSMNEPYDKCENPKPYPLKDLPDGKQEGLPVRNELTAEYRQIHATEAVALNKDTVTDLYFKRDEVSGIVSKTDGRKGSGNKNLTQSQRIAQELKPVWCAKVDEWLKENPTLTITRAVKDLERLSLTIDRSNNDEPFARGTVHNHIKERFPQSTRKGGRPKNK